MTTTLDNNGLQFNGGSILGSTNFQNKLINGGFPINQLALTGTVALAARAEEFKPLEEVADASNFSMDLQAIKVEQHVLSGKYAEVQAQIDATAMVNKTKSALGF
jgi:hypothetical protein